MSSSYLVDYKGAPSDSSSPPPSLFHRPPCEASSGPIYIEKKSVVNFADENS